MRPSEIHQWIECETRTLHPVSPPEGQRRNLTAAQLVGNYAHSLVATGNELISDDPGTVAWDDITPSRKCAQQQANLLAHGADYVLHEHRWTIFKTEQTVGSGRLDILARHQDGARAVIDLKTGFHPGAGAWLQVGAYLAALPPDGIECIYGGILHVPRRKLNAELTASLEMRPAELLRVEFRLREERIANLVNGAQSALPTPGMHCRRCWNNCVVRSMPPDE